MCKTCHTHAKNTCQTNFKIFIKHCTNNSTKGQSRNYYWRADDSRRHPDVTASKRMSKNGQFMKGAPRFVECLKKVGT